MRILMLLLVGLALLPGCAEADPSPLGLSIQPDDAVVAGKTRFVVTLVLEEPVSYEHPGCPPGLFSLVVEAGQREITLFDYDTDEGGSTCATYPATLQPGTYQERFHWNGRTIASEGGHTGDRVDPGTYPLTASLRGTTYVAFGNVTIP